MKYWLGIVSEDHVKRGVAGGFAQVCHGKKAPLARIKKNDWLIYYSPKKSMNGNEDCKSFTAIGQALDDCIFLFEMSSEFKPFRRKINYLVAPPLPLSQVKNKLEMTQAKNWGYKLRFGLIELSLADFSLLKDAMLEQK